MKSRLLLSVIIICIILLNLNLIFKDSSTLLYSWTSGGEIINNDRKELWIEIHDVSPLTLNYLEEVVDIIERYPNAYAKTVLFIIPNHGGVTPIHEYPEFVNKIQDLQKKGYTLGIHGYTHDLSNPEFNTDFKEAKNLLAMSENEFIESKLSIPEYFLPPGWRTTRIANDVLRDKFKFIYYYYYIDTPGGIQPTKSNEYVWYNLSYKPVEIALRDYNDSKGIFRLTLHLGAINTSRGLIFLDSYLGGIEKKSNIPSA
jgi:hypothetical protein